MYQKIIMLAIVIIAAAATFAAIYIETHKYDRRQAENVKRL